VKNYRESYDLYACTGILFNHEFPLHPARFVTQKIIAAAKSISIGAANTLVIRRMDIARDWRSAPEYVMAMWLMFQHDQPKDLVIATGESQFAARLCRTGILGRWSAFALLCAQIRITVFSD